MDPRFSIPPYQGRNGWIVLDLDQGASVSELADLMIESYRHFAPRRAIAAFDATRSVA